MKLSDLLSKTPVQFGTSGKNTVAAMQVEGDLLRPEIDQVKLTAEALIVTLDDQRQLSVPLSWYPRLVDATSEERSHFELQGNAIYWPDLDEDIDVRGLLLGRKSGESKASFEKWMASRSARR